MTECKNIVHSAVREAVKYCGSQAALAKKASISQGAVSKYLRRESLPTGVTARRLEMAVDNTIEKSRFAPHIFGDFDHGNAA